MQKKEASLWFIAVWQFLTLHQRKYLDWMGDLGIYKVAVVVTVLHLLCRTTVFFEKGISRCWWITVSFHITCLRFCSWYKVVSSCYFFVVIPLFLSASNSHLILLQDWTKWRMFIIRLWAYSGIFKIPFLNYSFC